MANRNSPASDEIDKLIVEQVASYKKTMQAIAEYQVSVASGGKGNEQLRGCFGCAGTFGTIGGTFGCAGTFGCYGAE
jgi:hypothetical protein